MYKARYYTDGDAKPQDRDLPDWLFDGVVNEGVLHQVVKAYRANQRQGTGSAKNRSAVRGGSRKPWRQKGTGRARQGTIRAAQWEGGGRAFPPIPHSWRQRIPKQLKGAARRSALNDRADRGRVLLVDFPELDAPKTAVLRDFLREVGVEGRALLLTDGLNETLYLSARNVQDYEVRPFGEESALDILRAETIVIERSALERATREAEESGVVERARRRRERREERGDEERGQAMEGAKALREEARVQEMEEAAPEAPAEPAPTAVAEPDAAEQAEPEPAEPDAAVDVDDIELPTVSKLAAFLADLDDPAVVRALQERDERKTAQAHYDARLAELEEDGTDG